MLLNCSKDKKDISLQKNSKKQHLEIFLLKISYKTHLEIKTKICQKVFLNFCNHLSAQLLSLDKNLPLVCCAVSCNNFAIPSGLYVSKRDR